MKKKGFIWGGIIILIIILSFCFDAQIERAISLIRTGFLDKFFLGITFISSKIIIFIFLFALFLWKKKKRKSTLPLIATLGATAVVGFLLKIIIRRPRPYQLGLISVLPVLREASHLIWDFSMPSFHTMFVFSVIPLLSKEFPKFKIYWIILAVLVGLSRLYLGVHFLSDILVGGVLGYLVGIFVVKLEDKYKIWTKIYKRVF